ncbi:hypothetical protein SY85_13045 [Flavisolibacter tropicus]|uniref:Uncharacterized protein n=2 Tax=Flavisolibacter tropicus TaxID=1492898 RepID=A0A172TW98_9BACT|nr:hypothetical protein SY85_13045 [Flavisolibacter tropicus]
MITKVVKDNELYVYYNGKILYKRWLKEGYGKVMDRSPFTARDTESFKQFIKDRPANKEKE